MNSRHYQLLWWFGRWLVALATAPIFAQFLAPVPHHGFDILLSYLFLISGWIVTTLASRHLQKE
jgi:hypothetical protein